MAPLLAPRHGVRVVGVPVVALIAGAALGLSWADVPALALVIGFLLPYLVVSAFAVHWAGAESRALLTAVGLAFAAGGALLAMRAWHDVWRTPLRAVFDRETDSDGRHALSATLTGTLRSDAAVRDDRVSLNLIVQRLEVRDEDGAVREYPAHPAPASPGLGGAAVSVGGELARAKAIEWRRGRTLRVPVVLRRPTRHLNPGAMDEERASARRGIALVGSAKSGALVEVVARGAPQTELAGAARAVIRRTIAAHVGRWSPRSAALVTAILIGDRAGVSADMARTLQAAGTYHTIAISGGNIAILAALTLTVFRWSGVLGRAAMLTAIAGFLAYGQLVESSASVTRAIVSAVLFFSARALDHRVESTQAVLVAAGVLVASDPLSIVDPGLLLSFSATAGIVAVFAWLGRDGVSSAKATAPGWSLARQALALVAASLAAEAALLPIAATFFGRITIAGLALNMVAIPAMTIAQVAGMLTVTVAAVSYTLADTLGGIAAAAGWLLLESGRLVTWLPAVAWRVAAPSTLVIAVDHVSLAGVIWARRPHERGSEEHCGWFDRRSVGRAGLAAAVASAFWIVAEPWTSATSSGDGRLHVTFIDVGQGDAAFVRFPRGATMLVDAGGGPAADYDIGDRVVAPVLKYLGVRRLGTIVVTHGDQDHAGGVAAILRDFQPFDLWEGVPVPPLPLLRDLRRRAGDHGVRWTTVQRHDSLLVDNVRVAVWHPAIPDWERQKVRNDDSIVVELRWGEASIVLAGDIGREVERDIAGQLEPAAWRVVKVPHHGSLTSSSEMFVRRLRPKVAVVSAGRGNPFGHPASAVVRRYEEAGASVFRTDRDGAITVETDGHRLDVRAFTGRQASWPRS